jgi:hypothetical protein
MQIIPLTNYPEQTFRITLDGVALDCRVYWCNYDSTCQEIIGPIAGQWRMDISGENIEVSGMALVAGCDLLEPFGFDKLGGLWLENDCTLEELGELYRLIYIPSAEVADYNRAIGYAR